MEEREVKMRFWMLCSSSSAEEERMQLATGSWWRIHHQWMQYRMQLKIYNGCALELQLMILMQNLITPTPATAPFVLLGGDGRHQADIGTRVGRL